VTTGLIIACAIGWTAAIVAITALVLARRARREAPRWRVEYLNGHGMLTSRKPLTEAEVEEIRARWVRMHGNNQGAHPVTELRPVDDEQACGCWNGVRCVKHCTCRQCTALRRPAASSKEQP
jgi:hypothetical protein